MTEITVSDKPWSFTGFGTIRCGRHTVLHLNPNLADEVSREEYERVGRLAAAAPDLWKEAVNAVASSHRLQDGQHDTPPGFVLVNADAIIELGRLVTKVGDGEET